jgi:hypothetical protein
MVRLGFSGGDLGCCERIPLQIFSQIDLKLELVELSDSTMSSAKSEIVLKFSELPQAKSLPDKKVGVELTDQNGIAFTAILNAKSWRKAEANAAGFEMWAGAISGKLGKGSQGLEIVDAGIQIFEKVRFVESESR